MTRVIVGVGELLWDELPGGERRLGGAPANFAFHARQLGCEGVIVSRVGADAAGEALRAAVRALGLTDEFVQVDPIHPTGTVQVGLSAAGVPTYTITENVAWDNLEWTLRVAKLLAGAAAISTGTLARRAGARGAVRAAVRACPGFRLADLNLREPLPMPEIIEETVRTADVLKVTVEELAYLTDGGKPAAVLARFLNLQGLVITDGAAGARWIGRAGDRAEVAGVPGPVVDTIGAGDAFGAAFVCGWLAGQPAAEALRDANRYAAEVCRHPGATPQFDWPVGGRAW